MIFLTAKSGNQADSERDPKPPNPKLLENTRRKNKMAQSQIEKKKH